MGRPVSPPASRIPGGCVGTTLRAPVFGVFTLTWVFSGLLSMEPYAWTRASGLELPRDVMTGGRLDLTRFPVINPTAWTRLSGGRGVKEVNLLRIQDGPYFEMTMSAARSPVADRVLVAAGYVDASNGALYRGVGDVEADGGCSRRARCGVSLVARV